MKQRACRISLTVSILLFSLGFFSCGIESFESLDPPNPPLGLTVYSTNHEIILTFQAYNPEESFSGYNIYVGNDDTAVRLQTTVIHTINGTLPTISMRWDYPAGQMQTITLTNSHNTNGQEYIPGQRGFWIGVAAYDAFNKRVSKTSDVVEIPKIYGP